ncbi:MAG: peptide-methionine (S)-S-oxide reductase MsrA [Flavobacteriaceae bacterium]
MKILTILFVTVSSLIISFTNTNAIEVNITHEQTQIKKAYFASGCFWCVEAIYERTKGVINVTSGYAGGHTKNPTYESSNTGRTGHAESVEVTYNADEISYATLVDIYYATQNPFQFNGQGPDKGSQYRSIIFFSSTEEKNTAWNKKKSLEASSKKEVASEIKLFEKFWPAENYHQDYEKNHPNHPYIINVSKPRIYKFTSRFPDLVK